MPHGARDRAIGHEDEPLLAGAAGPLLGDQLGDLLNEGVKQRHYW